MQHIIYGLHTVKAMLSRKPQQVLQIYLLSGKREVELEQLAKQARLSIKQVDRQTLGKMSEQANHQGVVAVIEAIQQRNENDLADIVAEQEQPFLLVLDSVQDPHNLGACLRSANAAGVHAVIAPKDRAVGLTPVVRKVASGAAELTPFIQVTNLARTLRWLKEQNIWVYGAAGEAEQSIYQADLAGNTAIVLGAEGKGLRRLTREHCDVLVHIPMQGSVSSLNVSVAAGICLFEAVRQRRS